jgi:hypothetical protein
MGNPKGDWGPTRDPKRNAQISRDADKQAAIEAAYLRHLQAFRERRTEKLPAVEEYINHHIPILLNAWQQQVDNAITDESYPMEPESKVFWWIALGGNLLWAATCFLNPAAAGEMVLIKLMSVIGAAIGTGVAEKASPPPDTPDAAKVGLRQQIAKARGKLEAEFQKKRREWASSFVRLQDWAKNDDTLLDEFNVYLWQQMFPTIPYDDDRFDQIRIMAVEAVKSAVADYNRQWKEFKRATVWAGQKELKKHHVAFQPVIRISFGGKPLWDSSDIAVGRANLRFH